MELFIEFIDFVRKDMLEFYSLDDQDMTDSERNHAIGEILAEDFTLEYDTLLRLVPEMPFAEEEKRLLTHIFKGIFEHPEGALTFNQMRAFAELNFLRIHLGDEYHQTCELLDRFSMERRRRGLRIGRPPSND
jgi:hypothetical protein